MLTSIKEESFFENNIEKAITAIKSNKYDLARKYLYVAMIENDHSAEVYNLLGIISEYKGNVILAGQYYRAAYVFNPTFKPADKNLEKLTSFFYIFNEANIDYGNNMEKRHQMLTCTDYNSINVGHLKVVR
jgi:hypothetical protein